MIKQTLLIIFLLVMLPVLALLILRLYYKFIKGLKPKQVNKRKYGPSDYKSMDFKQQSQMELYPDNIYPDNIQRRINSLVNSVRNLMSRVEKIEKRISDLVVEKQHIDPEQRSMRPGQIVKDNIGREMKDKTEYQLQTDRYEEHSHEPARVTREREKYDHMQPERTTPEVPAYGYKEYKEEEDYESLYNKAIGDQGKRNKFWEIYHPIRVGVTNSMRRRRDPSIEPEFQDDDGGDYLAVIIKGEAQLYAVFPAFDIILEESNYMPGAMRRVFECRDYEDQYRYKIVEVVKPAVFKRKAGNQWEIQRKGIINLEKRDE